MSIPIFIRPYLVRIVVWRDLINPTAEPPNRNLANISHLSSKQKFSQHITSINTVTVPARCLTWVLARHPVPLVPDLLGACPPLRLSSSEAPLQLCPVNHQRILTLEKHYSDAIMNVMASQITSLTIVYSTVYSGANQRKHQSSASLAFGRGIHRLPLNSAYKGPVTRKMFPFDDVIMKKCSPFLQTAFSNAFLLKKICVSLSRRFFAWESSLSARIHETPVSQKCEG